MSDAERLAVATSLEAMVERIVRRVLAEERPTSLAVEGFISSAEAGRRLGVKPAAIRSLVKDGKLAAVKVPGLKGWKFKPQDIDAFMACAQAGTKPLPSDPPPVNLAAHRLAASIQRGAK